MISFADDGCWRWLKKMVEEELEQKLIEWNESIKKFYKNRNMVIVTTLVIYYTND